MHEHAREGVAPVAVRVEVRWGDCDPWGNALYPRFFEWLEVAAQALARELGVSRADALPPRMVGLAVVSVEAEILAPARLQDVLEVRTWTRVLDDSTLDLRHEIARVDGGEVVVRARERRAYGQRDATQPMLIHRRDFTPAMRAILAQHAGASVA